jgi:hypothetical protein
MGFEIVGTRETPHVTLGNDVLSLALSPMSKFFKYMLFVVIFLHFIGYWLKLLLNSLHNIIPMSQPY